jgi:hypothetical protein
MERMLDRITNPSKVEPKLKWQWSRSYRIALPTLLCVLLIGIGLPFVMNGGGEPVIAVLHPIVSPAPMAISIEPRGVGLPQASEVRKFLNYNGSRYAFLNNGEPYDLSEWKLEESEPLGKLEYDIAADMQNGGTEGYASRDFGTTYLMGGNLYQLPGYDPAFRLAVERDDRYYIVQLVGRTDDGSIPAVDYVEAAHLDQLAERVELLDHSSKQLRAWSAMKDVSEWIGRISAFESAGQLTNEQYEQLAEAGSSGETYTLHVALKDGTAIDMLLNPGLRLISIGDSRYQLSEATYSDLFDSNDNNREDE